MKEMKDNFIKALPSFLYGVIVTIVTMIPYIPSNFLVIFLAVFLMGLLYTILFSVNEKKQKRICVLMYFLSFAFVFLGFKMYIGETSFYLWLLTGYAYSSVFIPYIILLFFVCILFFGTSSFYFTKFYYRGYIMIFMLLIPIALYYKMSESVPVIYIIAVVTSLIFLYVIEIQKRNLKKKEIKLNNAVKKFGIFVLVILLIVTAVTPKSDMAKYRDIFDEVIALNPFSNRNINAISTVSDKSSASSYGYLNQSRLLYTVAAYEPLYLKRSSFAKFEGEYFVNEYITYDKNWGENITNYNMREYYENMSALYELYPKVFEKYDIALEDIPNVTEESMNAVITPKRFQTNYLLGTVRTYNVDTDYYEYDANVVRDNNGCIRFEDGRIMGNSTYTIEYYRDIARTSSEILDFAEKFTIDEYINLINDLWYMSIENSDRYSEWLLYITKQIQENMRYNKENSEYSERVNKLAEEITKDCTTDYEKAVALERYFSENGFVYNIAYEPKEDTIEYFLFDSKEGSCREYATAMTLMAQSVGLCARYTEGFIMQEVYSDGTYYITAGNSHAYVEVYIPGYGFTVFEPTVADEDNETEGLISQTISRFEDVIEVTGDKLIFFLTGVGIILLLIILFNIFMLDKVKNKWMVMKCRRSAKPTELAYKYIKKLFKAYTEVPVENMTPQELGKFAKERYDVDISELVTKIEINSYAEGNEKISEEFIRNMGEIRGKIKN